MEDLATRDRSPQVRAAALEYLTFHRHLPALDMSAKALSSKDPVEVSAAVRGAVTLGGGAMAAALETRILEESDPVLQAAMLAAFTGYRSEEFREGCANLAVDRSRSLPVRAHAAAIAAAMGHDRMAPTLRGLFLDAEDPEILTLVATALVRVAPDEPPLADIHPPSSPEDLSRLDTRLMALVAANQQSAFDLLRDALANENLDLLRDALANENLDPVTKADLLRAWRLGAWPLLPRAHVDQLPPFLAALLR